MGTQTVLLLVLVLTGLLAVEGVRRSRVKLVLNQEHAESVYSRMKRDAGVTACEDSVEVDKSTLSYPEPFQNEEKIWERDHVKAIRSAAVTAGINALYQVEVAGLGGKTVGDVLNTMREKGCMSFVIGGSVRDQFLGRIPRDADVDFSCSAKEIFDACSEAYHECNCDYSPPKPVVGIGNELAPGVTTKEMDTASWDFFFNPPSSLEFSPNSMVYDTNGNDAVYDLGGTGADDTCKMQVRIPSLDGSYDSYVEWDSSPKKLFRFWKMRAKGFHAADWQTEYFLRSRAKLYMVDNPLEFSKFFCKKALGGDYEDNPMECTVDEKECKDASLSGIKYIKYFREDFERFWGVAVNYIPQKICKPIPPGAYDCPQGA